MPNRGTIHRRKNKANRIALKGNDPLDHYPGGDFRSPEWVELLKQAYVVTIPPFWDTEGSFNG